MKVHYRKLHPNAVEPFKTFRDDFCYDVTATSREEIAPDVYRYGLGLAFEIDREQNYPGFRMPLGDGTGLNINIPVNLSLDFRPRSSVWKTGLVLSNCQGTIDELYRGEVSAVFYHVNKNFKPYAVGDRIGQIKLGITLPLEFIEATELSNTPRGNGAYGSTGR